jgi:hypothetical protein
MDSRNGLITNDQRLVIDSPSTKFGRRAQAAFWLRFFDLGCRSSVVALEVSRDYAERPGIPSLFSSPLEPTGYEAVCARAATIALTNGFM